MGCEAECGPEIDKSMSKLEEIAKGFYYIKDTKEKLGFPRFLLKLESVIIEKIEDKIENYWIASDKEIRDLSLSISKKINKINASQ
ncbi:MAG: hypothetical protein MRK02_11030 [Candidatus Scalindua sp.]|nr:hypothetical protein [Candidatus Scalindua sp.]